MSDPDDTDINNEAKTVKQLMGPLKLFLGPLVDVAAQIKKQVDAEQDSKASIMRELRVLAAAVDRGDISEETFEAREEALLDKLEAIEARENTAPTRDTGAPEVDAPEADTPETSEDNA
jgi:hypothetical protein